MQSQKHSNRSYLCSSSQQGALTHAGGLEDYAERATIGLLNYHSIKNGFYLGQTEFRDLAGPMDYKELEDLGALFSFVATPCCSPPVIGAAK